MPYRLYIAAIILAGLTFFVFSPALDYGFINIDDYNYVYRNENIRSCDSDFMAWAFTSFRTGNWHPLTWLSLSIDYHLWGLDPMGYHLQNILLHAANVFLLSILIFKVLSIYRDSHTLPNTSTDKEFDFVVALLTALMFGLHPLRVESVVWVSERKDVLCALFFLLSLFWYLAFAQERGRGKTGWLFYLLSLAAFVLSLMAKAMAVTLPFVFLILDIICLKRIAIPKTASIVRLLGEKTPFLLLSLADAVIILMAQEKGGAVKSLVELSIMDRMLNAMYGLWFYFYKTILPLNLSPFYPFPMDKSLLRTEAVISLLFVIAVIFSCVVAYKRGRDYWIGIWAYYCVALLPVIGFVQIGPQRTADRYTYLPGMSLILFASLGLLGLFVRKREYTHHLRTKSYVSAFVASVALMLLLSYMTRQQIQIWSDSLSLANKAVEVSPDVSAIPYVERGFAWLDHDRLDNALKDCSHAHLLDPKNQKALMCRAEAHEKMGNYAGAISDYNTLLRMNPVNADTLNNRGVVYSKMGETSRAASDFMLRDLISKGRYPVATDSISGREDKEFPK